MLIRAFSDIWEITVPYDYAAGFDNTGCQQVSFRYLPGECPEVLTGRE
jgi:hypothetical protein